MKRQSPFPSLPCRKSSGDVLPCIIIDNRLLLFPLPGAQRKAGACGVMGMSYTPITSILRYLGNIRWARQR